MTGADIASAAEALIGTRFRLHGRDPATGLDCVGLLSAALARCGHAVSLPATYSLRSRLVPHVDHIADECGFAACTGQAMAGDVLLVQVSPCQFHLLIAANDANYVHAHASTRRVVKQHGLQGWRIAGHWRFANSV